MKNIKKYTAIISTVVLFTSVSTAQQAFKFNETFTLNKTNSTNESTVERPSLKRGEIGVRYMPTFSALDLVTSDGGVVKGSATMSNGFGIMLGLNITKNIGILSELSYYESTQVYKNNNVNREVKVSYINIPVLFSLSTDKTRWVNLNVVAGPQFGINAGANIKNNGTSSDTIQAVVLVKKQDIGFAYGAGVELSLNKEHTLRLDVGYRGFYGLVDMNSTGNSINTYNVIAKGSRKTYGAYIGFAFMF